MLLLHTLWLCSTFLAIECASVTASPSIIPSTEIQNGTDKIVIFSDSAVALANSRWPPKKESNAANMLNTSPETKHLRTVTNTSVFPDQLPPSVNNNNLTTNVSPKNVPSPAISSLPIPTGKNLANSAPSSATTSAKTPTSNTTSTTTTTTSTTTTTTDIPKKPAIAFSVEDQPDLLAKMHDVNPPMTTINETPNGVNNSNSVAAIAPPIEPIPLQLSGTISLTSHKDGRAFIVPMVAIIFIIPLLVILANFVTRQLRDYWSKRKYRRMDYLIEEMYH